MMQVLSVSSPEAYADVLAEHARVLVEFSNAPSAAGPCLEELLRELNEPRSLAGLTLLKVKLELLGQSFFERLGVVELPTLILVEGGNEIARHTGSYSPTAIEKGIQPMLRHDGSNAIEAQAPLMSTGLHAVGFPRNS